MPQILSITQINEYIQGKMNADPLLAQVAVRGEISNYKCYPSGHHYFTLKDEASALKCVMFKGNAMGLRFRPANGMKVIALGRISVYPRDGAYQLYCSAMSVDGVGDLYAAFEQLKAKLAAKGLFDPEKKKKLPKYPGTIGIVTSSAGAAVHDILRILRKRYPLSQVKLLPVRVQGAEAPEEIAGAIRYANAHRLADLLIVGRGGGSLEDLWAFNDERVAYAIYESEIPIISAVGHEPDVTPAGSHALQRRGTGRAGPGSPAAKPGCPERLHGRSAEPAAEAGRAAAGCPGCKPCPALSHSLPGPEEQGFTAAAKSAGIGSGADHCREQRPVCQPGCQAGCHEPPEGPEPGVRHSPHTRGRTSALRKADGTQ